ncbi:hypothetical protein ABMA28_009752 [Loxostege sticticalis]|uniref:Cytochrome P450 n=1 Tax=Loxostege sticticalis TaxID=481309 RepID=A0ABD0SBB5_LOXSC
MIFLIIVPSILCCVYAWRRRKKNLEGKLPPIYSGAWPFVGHIHLWFRGCKYLFWPRLLDMQKDCLDQGGVTYIYSGTNSAYTYYALADPSDCAKVANNCNKKYFPLEETIKAIFGDGLATAADPVWEKRRNLLEPMFDQISARLDVVNQLAKELAGELAPKVQNGFFDPIEILQNTIMGILLSTIYGEIEDKEQDSYKIALQEISDVVYERHRSFLKHNKLVFRWSNLKRRQDELVRTLKDLTNEIITRKRLEFNDSEPITLLAHLLRLENKGVYSEQNVEDEVNGFLFGGYNTMVKSLQFILVMIGSYTAVQECIYTEIYNILSDSIRKVNTEDLNNFIYLHAVVIEVLRLYPAVTTVSRKTQSSVDLKKYTIDPGTNCLLFIYAMNRHKSWGADRDEFKPERWLGGTTDFNIATFGLGSRSCIGMQLALSTMKIILIYLLREYKVIADHTKLVLKQKLMLTPESGYYIALEKRQRS